MSGSSSGSGSGSEGELRFAGPSSTPAAEVVSWAVGVLIFGIVGEGTGTCVGVVADVKGCAGLSTGDSGRGTAPGAPSVERDAVLNKRLLSSCRCCSYQL